MNNLQTSYNTLSSICKDKIRLDVNKDKYEVLLQVIDAVYKVLTTLHYDAKLSQHTNVSNDGICSGLQVSYISGDRRKLEQALIKAKLLVHFTRNGIMIVTVPALQAAFENYTLQEGDTKTYVTTSVAYLAQHANVPCKHEPWLHLRRCQKLVMRGREIVSNEIGYVVYIWDTREVVQWIDAKRGDSLRLNTPKAVDNAKPLKDVKHLLPDWVSEDVKLSGNLWSMANMPKEVQDRYYNR